MEAPSWVHWIVAAGAGVAASVVGSRSEADLAQTPGPQDPGRVRIERPDDPPGIPAPRLSGLPRRAPVQRASFASFQVNVDANGANISGDAASEPSIAVDPTNPSRLAIGWRQFDTVSSNFRQAGWGHSQDGGRTWTFPGVLEPGVFRSDPVLDSDASGNFYYNSVSVVGNAYGCAVFKSTDHGVTWGPAVPAFGGDKAWMAIDRTASQGAGHVYTAWSVFANCCGNDTFSRSTDGAQSFSLPVPIPDRPIWGTLDVSTSGTLFVGGRSSQSYSVFVAARSSNAKNAGVTPSFDLSKSVDLGGSLVYYQGSGTPNPGGLLGQVELAVDRSSGPTAGYVYMLCSVDPPGPDPLDVHFVRSTDNGATWSTPVRVNDDPTNNGAWQWFGTMSVAPNGRIDVVWNDTRNTAQASLCELYGSSSTDGGASWSPSQPLSPVWNSHIGWPNQEKIGDYYDMVSDLVGADLAYSATFNGEQDVYHLRIGDYDCNQNGVGDALDIASGTSPDLNLNGIPDECECLAESYCQGAPNSAGPGASIGWTGSLSIAANAFDLTVSGCPPGKPGLFFYGLAQAYLPFGNGFLCVGGSTFRLGPAVITSPGGTAVRNLDFTVPPASAGPGQIGPFSNWSFQFWYRDPSAGGAGFNLSDALSVTFCP
jgi:hypothetical protein